MTVMLTDSLLAPSRVTAAQVRAWYVDNWGPVPTAVADYLAEAERLCGAVAPSPALSMDLLLFVAQSIVETADPDTGKPWMSARWVRNHNPAGLAVESDNDPDPATFTAKEAAAVQYWAWLYMTRQTSTQAHTPASVNAFVERWTAKIKDPAFPYPVRTVADLCRHYVDSSGEPQATWAWDETYSAQLVARANDLLRSVKEDPVPTTNELRVIINPGHRNTTGGNPEEAAFTPKLANAYFDAFSAAGFETVNLGDTNGGLDEACRRMAAQIASAPGPCVLFDLHLEGEVAPGVFAIVPDITGLRTNAAVPQDPADTWENNTKDRELGIDIAKRICISTGLKLRSSGVREPGLMDESQTGVGGDGFRLATFAYTSPYRAKAVRLVVEHGCHTLATDHAIIFAPGFAEKCAQAAVQAVTAVYGSPSVPVPTPDHLRPAPIWWGRDAIGVQTNGNGDRALAMLAETHVRGKEATLYSVAVAQKRYAVGVVKPGMRLTLRGTTRNKAGRGFGFVEVPGAPDQVAWIAMSNLVEKWPTL